MTSDHDKLLAQGPRSAPDPPSADGFAAPAPVEEPNASPEPVEKPPLVKARPSGPRQGSGSGSWLGPALFRRLIPLVLVLVVVGRGFAGGRSGSWAFALVWIVAAALILVLRMRGRRP